jgi:hypothetical protein
MVPYQTDSPLPKEAVLYQQLASISYNIFLSDNIRRISCFSTRHIGLFFNLTKKILSFIQINVIISVFYTGHLSEPFPAL